MSEAVRRPGGRFGVRAKILAVGLVGLLASTVLLATTLVGLSQERAAVEKANLLGDARDTLLDLTRDFSDVNGWQTAYSLQAHRQDPAAAAADTAPTRASFLASYAATKKELDGLTIPEATDQESAGIAKTKEAYARFLELDGQVVAGYRAGNAAGVARADKLVMEDEFAVYDSLTDATRSVVDSVTKRAAAADADAAATSGTVKLLVIVTYVLGAAAVIALALLISRKVIASVTSLRDCLVAMGDGDLTVPVVSSSNDEIGEAAAAAEGTRSSMNRIIGEVVDAASSVAASAAHMSRTSQEVGDTARSASTQLETVTGAADEVSSNVQTVAAGTEEMSASIQEIARSAGDAAAVAHEAVSVAEETNATVAKLGESSAQIGEVVKAITSVAEQTNLLALNATIEAARAGEAGKGFAVVANEVKELAQETARATEDIGHRVDAIQEDTRAAVRAIDRIATIIARINDSQATIASAVEEQTATTNEMSRSVGEAAAGAVRIAADVGEAAGRAGRSTAGAQTTVEACGDLARRAEALDALVGTFRV